MYVCMYVCVCVCMSACLSVYMHACMCVPCMSVSRCVGKNGCMVREQACMCGT